MMLLLVVVVALGGITVVVTTLYFLGKRAGVKSVETKINEKVVNDAFEIKKNEIAWHDKSANDIDEQLHRDERKN